MEALVLIVIIIIALWIMRRSVRVWTNVSEELSVSKGREVLVNVRHNDAKTLEKAKNLPEDMSKELNDLDNLLGL